MQSESEGVPMADVPTLGLVAPQKAFNERAWEMANSTRDDGDTVGVILKINFDHLGFDPDDYLDHIQQWRTWRTRTPIHTKCGQPGWKLIPTIQWRRR